MIPWIRPPRRESCPQDRVERCRIQAAHLVLRVGAMGAPNSRETLARALAEVAEPSVTRARIALWGVCPVRAS